MTIFFFLHFFLFFSKPHAIILKSHSCVSLRDCWCVCVCVSVRTDCSCTELLHSSTLTLQHTDTHSNSVDGQAGLGAAGPHHLTTNQVSVFVTAVGPFTDGVSEERQVSVMTSSLSAGALKGLIISEAL